MSVKPVMLGCLALAESWRLGCQTLVLWKMSVKPVMLGCQALAESWRLGCQTPALWKMSVKLVMLGCQAPVLCGCQTLVLWKTLGRQTLVRVQREMKSADGNHGEPV
jgi:hypothetical protein